MMRKATLKMNEQFPLRVAESFLPRKTMTSDILRHPRIVPLYRAGDDVLSIQIGRHLEHGGFRDVVEEVRLLRSVSIHVLAHSDDFREKYGLNYLGMNEHLKVIASHENRETLYQHIIERFVPHYLLTRVFLGTMYDFMEVDRQLNRGGKA